LNFEYIILAPPKLLVKIRPHAILRCKTHTNKAVYTLNVRKGETLLVPSIMHIS